MEYCARKTLKVHAIVSKHASGDVYPGERKPFSYLSIFIKHFCYYKRTEVGDVGR